MKRLFSVLIVLSLVAYSYIERTQGSTARPERAGRTAERTAERPSGRPSPSAAADPIAAAFAERRSDVQVEGRGVVHRVLADDNDGSRHQRFVLRLANGQTVLVAHNIDLADRLTSLDRGDTVVFYGEYEWSEQGGVIHWTHRDPARRHVSGWLQHEGRRVQ
ncbi:MAG: DUF3465 domain-containing protein [Gemmatimonadaceae bacterium]